MMSCSEIRKNTKDEFVGVIDRMRKMEETVGEQMRKMDETVGEMKPLSTRMRNMEESVGEIKNAVDQILQKLSRLEPSTA